MRRLLPPKHANTPVGNSGYTTPSSSRYGGPSSRQSSSRPPSSRTSNGIHSATMTPQTSNHGSGSLGNDAAALNGLGRMFDGTPQYIPGADDPLAQFSPHGLSSHLSADPVSIHLDQLNRELNILPIRVQNLASQLNRAQLQTLGNLFQFTFAGIYHTIQSRMNPPVPPVQSRRTRNPPSNAKYYCLMCNPGITCSSRGTFKRHVEERHGPRYHYGCPLFDDCDWQGARIDKAREHVQKKHAYPEKLTADQIRFNSAELRTPVKCPLCDKPTNSWDVFFICVAYHCFVRPDRLLDGSGDGGGGNGNGEGGSDPNDQYFPGSGSGGTGYNNLPEGDGNGSGDPFYRDSFDYAFNYHGANPGQLGVSSPMHTSDIGDDTSEFPELNFDEDVADDIKSIAKSISSASTVVGRSATALGWT